MAAKKSPASNGRSGHQVQHFAVRLPAGGELHLHGLDEVALWEESAQRYIDDYALEQQNDLMLVGAILSQQLAMFRAQKRLNGMEPDLDAQGTPTGRYTNTTPTPAEMSAAQSTITKAAEEIRELEKALGIDKKTREAGGQHTVAQYVGDLKQAAREYGIHLSRRLTAYEAFNMELRWKLRLLLNGDPEDRSYHRLTPQSICDWAREELADLEEVDKTYAREKGKIFVGRLS